MEKIRLEILGMSNSQSQSGAYALILAEKEGNRRLPIIIGSFEAQAIAIKIEKIKTPRPLTHDLFKTFADAFDIVLREVVINKFVEGIFYSILVCSTGDRVVELDSRTSDAIALALRFKCPVYTFESIMATAGVLIEEDQESVNPQESADFLNVKDTNLSDLSVEELEILLQDAVEKEDYEKASKIRDELKNRR